MRRQLPLLPTVYHIAQYFPKLIQFLVTHTFSSHTHLYLLSPHKHPFLAIHVSTHSFPTNLHTFTHAYTYKHDTHLPLAEMMLVTVAATCASGSWVVTGGAVTG